MSGQHNHDHGSENLKVAFFLNLAFTIIEIIGGSSPTASRFSPMPCTISETLCRSDLPGTLSASPAKNAPPNTLLASSVTGYWAD